jgi:AAA+ ATPase superfamily predicted ATPase
MTKVDVDDELFSVLEARATEKNFEDTEDYIKHLLQQVVQKIKKEKENGSYSDEEEEEVKKRLKGLGYLD